MREIAFTAKVQKEGRIAIPKPLREAYNLQEGDKVTVKIRKEPSLRFPGYER